MNTNEAKEIINEEKKVVTEIKKEQKLIAKVLGNVRLLIILAVVFVVASVGGILYFVNAQYRVSIDNSQVSATAIDLASGSSGKLEVVYVNEGDYIDANTVVARVGNELVKAKVAGIVIMARQDIGKIISPGEKVVSIIDPYDLRIVGRLAEDKGLAKVSVGERASFTVDAFGSRKFVGVVDEVSPTSRTGDVVFSISDKRQAQEFNVKVRFDVSLYPELKNGMSAKLTVFSR